MDADAGMLYRSSRLRLSALLSGLDDARWSVPVPACPGWDVKAVLSHLVGNVDDALAGRLTGPPTTTQTADQVERAAAVGPRRLLATWSERAPHFEQVVSRFSIWPAALDALTHEHDICAAVGAPGVRDDHAFRVAARVLVDNLDLHSVTVQVDLGDEVLSTVDRGAPRHRVATTGFEVTRIRLGRRSADQVLAMPWSPRLTLVPDELFVFGPRDTPLEE